MSSANFNLSTESHGCCTSPRGFCSQLMLVPVQASRRKIGSFDGTCGAHTNMWSTGSHGRFHIPPACCVQLTIFSGVGSCGMHFGIVISATTEVASQHHTLVTQERTAQASKAQAIRPRQPPVVSRAVRLPLITLKVLTSSPRPLHYA